MIPLRTASQTGGSFRRSRLGMQSAQAQKREFASSPERIASSPERIRPLLLRGPRPIGLCLCGSSFIARATFDDLVEFAAIEPDTAHLGR